MGAAVTLAGASRRRRCRTVRDRRPVVRLPPIGGQRAGVRMLAVSDNLDSVGRALGGAPRGGRARSTT
ncbi:hypothetical protein FRACA_480025 [Frankia canadensis]|uniref:Uncharacterized protein n=1 Tax=Frankia canadensis TaxID=1836972 RepID=A0A2I2KY04_9ACTN|nr:hypothetical protein FRACA_480025 [Frankia canadensis]SOU57826.1 hypothetical protein FRACA_480025 [Frankia canadensis]